MALSIRTRLTMWYAALLTVSLLAFGTIFSFTLFKIFIARTDNQALSVANMMVHTVIKPSGKLFLPNDFDIILSRFFGIRTEGNYIQVLEPTGKIIAKSSNLGVASIPLSIEDLHAVLGGSTTYEIVRPPKSNPIRVITKPIIFKDQGVVGIIQVGTSLEGMDEIFHSIAYIFIIGGVGVVVVASVVGWFLAVNALKPVAEITELTKKIEAGNLSQRISVTTKDELGELAMTINEMIDRLERSFVQIQRFTADASHELKTPLTVLKGEMEVALRSKNTDDMKEALLSALEEIDRMNYIVRSLLDLARIDAEAPSAAKAGVRLDNIVSERCESLKRLSLDKGVELVIIKSVPSTISADPVRVSQLVNNLIDNAIKYTNKGGRVEVSVWGEGAETFFRVKDSGMGIAKEELPHIFDRFYRVDKARSRDAGGAGLGLSICKEIAGSLGGTIEVESEPGKGSVFTVRLGTGAFSSLDKDMAKQGGNT